jgi:hypothetical protein
MSKKKNCDDVRVKNSPCESGRMRGLRLHVSKILLDGGDFKLDRGSIGSLKIGWDEPERKFIN